MIMGIGPQGIDGETGSRYLIAEWGYPDTGVVIASEGHTAFMLDYGASGPKGEPRVLWVAADAPETNVVLAPTFEAFLSKLKR